MAYRRLPNTDNARLIAVVKLHAQLLNKDGLVENHKIEVVNFYKKITQLIARRKELVMERTALNKVKKELLISLRLYVSHFFQVLNFAIERGDVPKSSRIFFKLGVNNGNIPSLSKETDVISWANRIIVGEQKRIENGVETISHPHHQTINSLKNEGEKLINELKKTEKNFSIYQQEIISERNKIDAFIKQIWNEIEHQFMNESIEIKRKKAARYGVVYVE